MYVLYLLNMMSREKIRSHLCSDRILRLLRKVHPPTALRLRARSGGHSGLGCAVLVSLAFTSPKCLV